jgi:hypothetical protein
MNEGYAIKKPIPVHFVQWEGKYGKPEQVKMPGPGLEHLLPCPGLLNAGIIETPEGPHVIREGDYVMGPGAAGEYWPIKKEIFEATYDVQPSNGNERRS